MTVEAYDSRDPRLNHLLRRDPMRCASLDEYASAAGVTVAKVAEAFAGLLDGGSSQLEVVQGHVFLLTGIGRHRGEQVPVPANLWEVLRRYSDTQVAYRRWRLTRALERAGWRVEVDVAEVMEGLSHVRNAAAVGVRIGEQLIPVVDSVTARDVADTAGPISDWMRTNANVILLTCPAGQLDDYVTAVRVLFNAHRGRRFQVVMVEEPGFDAVVVDSADTRVTPVDVSRFFPGGRTGM